MIAVDLYIGFEKRNNSTKRPSSSDTAYTINGFLREPCSLEHPTINFKEFPSNIHPQAYNYCFILAFSRYYFIIDWTWNNGLWECTMEEDYLGSWKNQIGASSAYIERCAYTSDGTIIDRLYPAKNNFVIESQTISTDFTDGWDIDDGTYILGVISSGNTNNVGGAVKYYAMTQTQLTNMFNYLLSDTFYDAIGFSTSSTAQLDHDVAKSLINPIQYITSCMWFPAGVSKFTASNTDVAIMVGPWTTIGQGKPLTQRVGYTETFNLTIPEHPQASTRGAFLNYAPYARYTCLLPPFGQFNIDPSYIPSNRRVDFRLEVDGITGKASIQMFREDTTLGAVDHFFNATAMFGVPIQLAQASSDYLGALKAGMSGIASMGIAGATLGAGGAEVAFLGTIGNVISNLAPSITSEGANGSFIAFERLIGTPAKQTSQFVTIVEEDNTELGRPLCEVRTINTLPGFIKCGEVTVDYPCLANEKDIVHKMLLSGFFWE